MDHQMNVEGKPKSIRQFEADILELFGLTGRHILELNITISANKMPVILVKEYPSLECRGPIERRYKLIEE